MPQSTIAAHTGPATGVAFSADGETLFTTGADKLVREFNTADGKPLQTYEGPAAGVNSLRLSADGKKLFAGTADGMVLVWTIVRPAGGTAVKPLLSMKQTAAIRSVSPSADGGRVAVGTDDNFIRLCDTTTGLELERYAGHAGAVTAVALSGDGGFIVSGSADKTVRRFLPTVVAAVKAHEGPLTGLVVSADSTQAFTAGADKAVVLWSLDKLKEIRRFTGPAVAIKSISASSDGHWLAGGGEDKNLILWSVENAKPVLTVPTPSAIGAVAVSSDGGTVVAAGADKIVRTYGLQTSANPPVATLVSEGKLHSEPITAVALAADDHTLLTASADKTVKSWFAASRAPRATYVGHTGPVYSLAFSADSKTLAERQRRQDRAAVERCRWQADRHWQGAHRAGNRRGVPTRWAAVGQLLARWLGIVLEPNGRRSRPDQGYGRRWSLFARVFE